jgi:hypothetical protein
MATSRSSTRHTAARKAANHTTGEKKASAKKTTSAGRKYGPTASSHVEEEMREMKQGKLKSGRSGKKVTDPKQAIAIGLSEARKAGAKVPKNPRRKAA